ncbi:MAG TPA: prepilin-type N-terminal cleavage/methylation domain-containing protein [Candidatus Sumerlaeota bacterium]|nr:MAG: hypothetical protein BWZ08_01293 [candidate division BRC1 bacterium ADurb.BinA292]HOR28257.1 prepilin-type N-terminal cleavage/methylation domain-containing protein [Candidatus Sumerlaeota bacterium]HPK03906.1 prepilin-type N-terminal cleavage/methylation domain-containing protein [Candidatus Sumerlaeota bacterium]
MSGARRGFVLLEVLLSLTILGMAVAAFMHSFTQSLRSARLMEIRTQAMFFADQLMDEFEIFPPASGRRTEGGFGEDYAPYYYEVEMKVEEPRYRLRDEPEEVERFFATRVYTLEIYYRDESMAEPLLAARVSSAVVGFEKFSSQTKQSYAYF